jgi:hypothetical protein
MALLYRLFGPPHEALHVLALWLIGRRPRAVSFRHVDLPDDLSTRQYVFVAGLPALVFWSAALIGALRLAAAANFSDLLLGFAVMSLGGLAGLGTYGDLRLIWRRLNQAA